MNITNLNILSSLITQHYTGEIKVALDITLGNGYDIERIISSVQEKLYAFDIQKEAVERSKERLSQTLPAEEYDKITFVNDSHEFIDKYMESVDLVFGNLGYLPHSDHVIRTQPHTTLVCLSKALDLLTDNGLMCITSYLGHDRGREHAIIESFFSTQDPRQFKVLSINPLNQAEDAPKLFVCQKIYR